jgi:SAM-dependent methyltransferase
MSTAGVDEAKLEEFMGRMIGYMTGGAACFGIWLGDELGLYSAVAENPGSADDVAATAGCNARLVREWLDGQVAAGLVDYDAEADSYSMNPEATMALADDSSPVFTARGMNAFGSMFRDIEKIKSAFTGDGGLAWGDHDACLFKGTEWFFRTGYRAYLPAAWIPALDGVEAKLKAGAKVADVGCGHGASTIVMAKAFPRSEFFGFDYHPASIAWARKAAADAGVADRVIFEVAPAKHFPGTGYDLVAFFDCLHDMGDPIGAARHVLETLASDGTWMIVEPFANDRVEDNLNPIGRVFYCASTMVCTPASLAQEVGLGLGAQAGEAQLRAVVTQGGFTRFRRATATSFNLVLEARP